MGWTTPRTRGRTTIAIAHSTAFGTAASAAGTIVRAQALEADVDRGTVYIDPQGTTGSEFDRDSHSETAQLPRARLKLYAGSRALLAALLEHATHGRPTATLAGSDLTESNEGAGVLGTWTFAGVRPGFNTDAAWKLYVTLTDETPGAGQARVSVYSDSGRSQLVAQGSAANGATATLAEQNSSGLSGTVALGTVTATDSDIEITILRVRFARSATIDRYFTLFRDTGAELEVLSGCTVQRLRLSSREADALMVEVDILAAAYASLAATTMTPALASGDKEYFAHAHAEVTYNASEHSALALVHGIEHDVEQDLANAAAPTAIWKRGSRCLPIEITQRFAAESRGVVDDGIAGTWRQVTATYAYGSKELAFTYPRCKLTQPSLPGSRQDGYADHALTLEARDDGSADPVQIILDL